MKTKFAIGCLVQWYECDMIDDYIESLTAAVNYSQHSKNIMIDFTFITNQDLEKISGASMTVIIGKWREKIKILKNKGYNITDRFENRLSTIADYRREFNTNYCNEADVLIWGESDALLPKQMFVVLNNLHHTSLQNNSPKYLAFFGTCKMWDESWKCVEHTDMTDKPVDNKKWWGTRYHMSIDEMNKINDKVEELDVRIVSPHKFNGCGLVISSEVIKAGVNIPKSIFFTHEDSAFMFMTQKILGNIPQYIIKNILLVHNREHNKKRMYVSDEVGNTLGEQRESNNWYSTASEMSKQNGNNLFNNKYKSYTWKDVWKNIK